MLDTIVNKWRHVWDVKHPTTCTIGSFLFDTAWNNHVINVEQWQLDASMQRFKLTSAELSVIRNLLDNKTCQTAQRALVSYCKTFGKNKIVKACKDYFPSITPMALFHNRRSKSFPKTFTNIINIDIDNVPFERAKQIVSEWGYAYFLGESITRTGFHILVKVNSDDIKGHIFAIRTEFKERFNIDIDPQFDPTRLRYYCDNSDNNYYLNENALTYSSVEIFNHKAVEHNDIQLGITTEFDKEEYAESCHLKGLGIAAEQLNLQEGEIGEALHTYIGRYQWAYNAYGISLEYAVQYAWSRFFKEHEYVKRKRHTIDKIRKDFSSFYNTYKHQHHTYDFEMEKKSAIALPTTKNTLKLLYGDKISSLDLEQHLTSRFVLIAPTNSGKTTFFINRALTQNVKTILIVSLQSAIQQALQDHPTIDVYYQYQKTAKVTSSCIVTTYSSFSKVVELLKDVSDWCVIFDEVHNAVLSADKNYRSNDMNEIFRNLDNFKQVGLMTGTWVTFTHPFLNNCDFIKVDWHNPPLREYVIKYLPLKEVYEKVATSCQSGRHLIYLDDKNEEGKLGKMIEYLKAAQFKDDEILLVNANQKKKKGYQNLIETGNLPKQIKVVIATKIFVESLNLYNQIDEMHILSPLHWAWIHQLATRPRLHVPKLVNLYWSDNIQLDTNNWFNTAQRLKYYVELANEYIEHFEDEMFDDVLLKIMQAENRVKNVNLMQHANLVLKSPVLENGKKVGSIPEVNYLGCAYLANIQQVVAYYKNPLLLAAFLKAYGWTNRSEHSMTVTLLNSKQVTANLKSKKDASDKLQKAFVKQVLLSSYDNNDFEIKKAVEENWQMMIRIKLRDISKRIGWSVLCDVLKTHPSIIKAREYNDFLKKLQVCQMLILTCTNIAKNQTSVERQFADFLYQHFTLGKRYSSDEIHQTVTTALSRHPLYKLSNKSQKATHKILSYYVTMSRKQIRIGKDREWRYEIVAHWPLVLILKSLHNYIGFCEDLYDYAKLLKETSSDDAESEVKEILKRGEK